MTHGDKDVCRVCGSAEFQHTPVLWPALISAWELSEGEARIIDEQQGTHCVHCGANIRSIALASALLWFLERDGTLEQMVVDARHADMRVLEINEAGTLHPTLRRLPRHELVSYPEIDLMALAIPADSFDVIVHSDTLEHVADPLQALRECRRVLVRGGALAFTVPVVPGRLTRSRAVLSPSYHGREDALEPGLLVHTEFGADVWATVVEAGFRSCELIPFRFPAGLAILARK